MRSERSTERAEWAERVGKLAARAGLRRGIQSEAALWNARESSLGAEPAGERGCASEKRALGGRERATNVAEIAAGGFRARAPTPAAVHNGVNFHARRDSAQVQIGERGSDPEESLRQVPVFIARVSVDTQPQAGITEDGRGKGEEKAALLRIPPHERGEIQGAMSQIVHFRVKRGVGQAAQERNGTFKFRIAPEISLRQMQRQVVISGIGGREFGAAAGKNIQIVETRFRGKQRIARQDLRSVEGQGAIAKRLVQLQERRESYSSQSRLVFGIPIFQGRFEIALEKIDGGEKFAGVGVARI